ncbi:hypothetical protein NCS52_01392100 [Fusarium sp. LHS14.1]|nr:hypothetical protein NCS52_01392100 [Fusarium sp. LHS14.1]
MMIGHIGSHGSVRDALGKRRAEDSDIRRPRDTSCSALNARLHHLRSMGRKAVNRTDGTGVQKKLFF